MREEQWVAGLPRAGRAGRVPPTPLCPERVCIVRRAVHHVKPTQSHPPLRSWRRRALAASGAWRSSLGSCPQVSAYWPDGLLASLPTGRLGYGRARVPCAVLQCAAVSCAGLRCAVSPAVSRSGLVSAATGAEWDARIAEAEAEVRALGDERIDGRVRETAGAPAVQHKGV
jgi:hypothetical protein